METQARVLGFFFPKVLLEYVQEGVHSLRPPGSAVCRAVALLQILCSAQGLELQGDYQSRLNVGK